MCRQPCQWRQLKRGQLSFSQQAILPHLTDLIDLLVNSHAIADFKIFIEVHTF